MTTLLKLARRIFGTRDDTRDDDDTSQTRDTTETPSCENNSVSEMATESDQNILPEKPVVIRVLSHSVKITCRLQRPLRWDEALQVRYKDVDCGRKWQTYPEEIHTMTFDIKHLRPSTKYVFKARVVTDDHEGHYSPVSEEIVTKTSVGEQLAELCAEIKTGQPAKMKIPLVEISTGRNDTWKIRTFAIGSRNPFVKEKTIMLIGATGTGKSTIVDGLVNYALNVKWEDRYRFSIVNLATEEEERNDNQALSQTEWVTCYSLYPMPGGRLSYKINIIDTPGFGDTRGIQRDREIVVQIRNLFENLIDNGITTIDAVCFMVKASDVRLTAIQIYIFHSIMSLFGKNMRNNICTLITFADGQNPQVKAALNASGLPFGESFNFNNASLFANNTLDTVNRHLLWNMACEGYRLFFTFLTNVEAQSLTLTSNVLKQREKLEVTITNLKSMIETALSKMETMRLEIKIIEQHEVDIEANRNFEYEVEEQKQVVTDAPRGVHVTNCLSCNRTCHARCDFANDDDKAKCNAMKRDGYCSQCALFSKRCHWQQHKNTRVIFSIKSVKRKMTYNNKLVKYQQANGKLRSSKDLIETISKDINDLDDLVRKSVEIVNECNIELKEIALNTDHLTTTEHIDVMIDAEKQEKKPGFEDRINALKECKQRAEILTSVQKLLCYFDNNKVNCESLLDHMKGTLS